MIGERLAEIRKDHNDTQVMLANKLDVSLATIRSWEQEKSSPSHEMLVAICKLYEVSADYLLGLTNTDPSYFRENTSSKFSEIELIELRKFEEYLIWKRKNQ